MRIAVFGTGGVGGYFGGRLAHAGEDVTFIARGEHLRAIKTNGLIVDSLAGNFVVFPAQATDDVNDIGEVDLVIVGVKAWQVPEAARAIKPLIGPGTTVLPLQNGVDAVSQLVDELGRAVVIGGLCRIVSFVVEPGHIKHAGFTPSIVIGEIDNQRTDRINLIEGVFKRAGLEITVAADIQAALWTKFLFIASFSGVGAMANAPAGVLRSDPKWSVQMLKAMEEIYALALARGIKLAPDSIDKVMASVKALPDDATSSMQRDIAAGRPSELESQNGAVVRLGRESGVEVPTHTLIYETLKPREEKARAAAL
ncbi:MAG TPA: 2-dehydropantoate 2-reductase [Pyrinomonadaceae bacterium]|jgi:2-dehydropantoate 2-reductase|nr:2-dehydropantoate 2-reductase [Pyrinomonadaceae bacterium]